ncbi:MAG: DUF2158 domain-containing protein [Mesorhizobium sp.]|nr:MAG: DUF2158 domain-containing protein [Mesorhizobium sp.]
MRRISVEYTAADKGGHYGRNKVANQIQPGSVVKLKSGGPSMTVRWVEGEDAHCEWFLEGKTYGHTYIVTQLKLVE